MGSAEEPGREQSCSRLFSGGFDRDAVFAENVETLSEFVRSTKRMNAIRTVMKWILGLLFAAAGINHFLMPETYVAIMPPYLPWPLTLVCLSGAAEALLGILLLIPKFQSRAAWGLIALLIAVFPANLHMALKPDEFPDIPPVALWIRLPLQAVLIAWAYWFTRKL